MPLSPRDLARLITPDGPIRRGGSGYLVRCPAHKDGRPSLSVWLDDRGRYGIHCFAGCETDRILELAGGEARREVEGNWGEGRRREVRLPMKDRQRKRRSIERNDSAEDPEPEEDAIAVDYEYRDEDGELLFIVRRDPGKRISQWHYENGELRRGRKGIRTVLYGLPDLAARPEALVYWVEGEKDADRLRESGLLAVTNVGGAGYIEEEWFDPLAGRDVVVIPDNDDPGRAHAEDVLEELDRVGARARLLELDVPPKGDVSDWLDAGGDILDLMENAETLIEAPPPPPSTSFGEIYLRPALALLEPPETILGLYLVRNGLNMLFGEWGTAKSFVAIDWAASLATGLPWLGHENAAGPERVLYWAGEGRGGLHARLAAWELHHQTEISPDHFIVPSSTPKLDRPETFDDLRRLLRHYEIRHLVIDTMIRVKGEVDENAANEIGELLSELAIISQELGVTILLVHHVGHEAKGRPRGSSSIGDNLDGLYRVTGKEGIRELSVRKLKDQPIDGADGKLHFVLQSVDVSEEVSSAVLVRREPAAIVKGADELLEILGDEMEPVPTSYLVGMLDVSQRQTLRRLNDLAEAGLVARLGTANNALWALRERILPMSDDDGDPEL